jgi:hypothetical protein
MMSCGASVVWSHLVLSHCCTEHDYQRGIVLSDRITTVAISNSGEQMMHCSSMSARLAGHDDSSVRRLGNVRTCLRNTRAYPYR